MGGVGATGGGVGAMVGGGGVVGVTLDGAGAGVGITRCCTLLSFAGVVLSYFAFLFVSLASYCNFLSDWIRSSLIQCAAAPPFLKPTGYPEP